MTEDKKEKNDEIVLLADTNFRNQKVRFGIKKDDRRRHMYIIGKTGMGKSTVMENMIIQDIQNGSGVALVDPHGDFAEKILDFIPSHRINDVVYLNPADIQHPVAFNVMESVSEEHKHLIASGLVGVFKKLWADSWGPRLEYLLRNAILALLDYPGSTLLGVMRILVDKNYRKKVIAKIQDPVVKAFWVEEFSKYPQQFQVEAVAPIQNKVGQFLSTAMIRNIVGQVKSSFDLRDIMDNQKILIMNLSKGRIGEDSSALLGAMMITKIQLAAMSRIDLEENKRKDFYLYVDEFQNFATESFANILSEARKYRLNLIIGHQYIEQLDETVAAAVFGNVGTLMCFRVGSSDAEALAVEFAPYFTEEDLVNLTKYDVYLKLMIDGVASTPFSATTLPPLDNLIHAHNREKVINVSRERYAKPREVVEDKISRWTGVDEAEEIPNENKKLPSTPNRTADENNGRNKKNNRSDKKSKPKETYTVNCYECGNPTEITFKPDGLRPVYCPDCFKEVRERLMKGEDSPETISEIIPEPPQPEISLSEALTKPPQVFEPKRSEKTKEEKMKEPKKEPTPQPKSEPKNPKSSVEPAKPISIHQLIKKKIEETPQNNDLHQIKPGQVVKF